MEPFVKLSSVVAPLSMINVDTDMIIPKQFLTTIKRTGLGKSLFFEMRYDDNGNEIADFVLNKPEFRQAKILLAGANFGCGSSREHAPWALLDFGIKCVIAPSFADIFYNNCFKNGILPITLDENIINSLFDSDEILNAQVDLKSQQLTINNGNVYEFDIDKFKKHCLLNGLDDIALTLEKDDKITAFEQKDSKQRPWLYQQA